MGVKRICLKTMGGEVFIDLLEGLKEILPARMSEN